MTSHPEIAEIVKRYERRAVEYDLLAEWMVRTSQERERVYLEFLRKARVDPSEARLLEVGCGAGRNLQFFLAHGFPPQNLVGNELLEARQAIARATLPNAVRIIGGDATLLDVDRLGQFQIVAQHLVFSSILDRAFQARLARTMWELVAPGGAVLWYDLRVNNPWNPDVRGIPTREVRRLFPDAMVTKKSVTLAPPLARFACKLSGGLYPAMNLLPFLRTHIACWLAKRA